MMMKKVILEKVRVIGNGNSKQQAISLALGKIQTKIMSKYKEMMIIRIEPINVNVIEAKQFEYIERFLFFLFPRKRYKYKVTLDVEVNLFLLDVNEIPFEEIKEQKSIKNIVFGSQFTE
jgi:uncharacterized protein (TIGR03578 family)